MRCCGVVLSVLLAAAALVWDTSYAAFSSTTVNPANQFRAATVTIGDDDGGTTGDATTGTAMFTVVDLATTPSGTKCIVVSYAGSVPADTRLYVSARGNVNSLASYVDMDVDVGTGSSFGSVPSCSGFTKAASGGDLFTGTAAAFFEHNSYAAGLPRVLAPGSATTYRISYNVPVTPPEAVRDGGRVEFVLTWEARNE